MEGAVRVKAAPVVCSQQQSSAHPVSAWDRTKLLLEDIDSIFSFPYIYMQEFRRPDICL